MSEEEKELNEAVESVDSEEHEKMLQQPEKEKAIENGEKNAHTAVKEVYDWFESLLMAVVFIVLLFTFVVRVNTVDGTSMTPTLKEGQKLVVTDLFYTPDYNDIVIIQAAKLDGGKPIVKRIIGLPGDTVMIDFEAGLVYRNGEQLNVETKDGFLYEDGHKINTYTNKNIEMLSKTEYTVPKDCYFVLGDNRNGSKDSRAFSSIGFVDGDYIAGRAIFSLFPFSSFGLV